MTKEEVIMVSETIIERKEKEIKTFKQFINDVKNMDKEKFTSIPWTIGFIERNEFNKEE